MIYEASPLAVVVFFLFVGVTLGLSFFLGRKAQSSEGYFAAHGQIPWFVNGIAFAGDYLSAASFLGICGMISFFGYDGFLYSIGFLAGWIVALFVVAEPMKRLGQFTFADALDSQFQSRGIKLAAGISTLAVSVFYLIPQMVGAGVLIQPLLGFDHYVGVLIVGTTVILIVVSAGMVSTTWVQFIKGSLLVIFSAILTIMILARGFKVPEENEFFRTLGPVNLTSATLATDVGTLLSAEASQDLVAEVIEPAENSDEPHLVVVNIPGEPQSVWSTVQRGETTYLAEAQTHVVVDGKEIVNGKEKGTKKGEQELKPIGHLSQLPAGVQETGGLGPFEFLSTLQQSEIILWGKKTSDLEHPKTTVYYQKPTLGKDVLRPGTHPKFKGIQSNKTIDKVNFLSLMLALFCGTASLPHILIRYYTVKDGASARKSTIVGIASIGFFYILTLFLGLGAMTSGALDVTNSNMAAPLLAKSMADWLFAIISAIAFTTVLGTVSGLILASSGAVTHDLLKNVLGYQFSENDQVRVAKIASVVVGAIAIVLGILFEGLNVGYLVGWAFSVAASANLPSLLMLLFWKRTTSQGIIAAILVGMVSSLGWILLSGDTFSTIYGLSADDAWVPFDQPGLVTIPLGFLTLVIVSLMTQPKDTPEQAST